MATRTSPKPEAVLVHPNSRSEIYQALGEELAAVEPPVWAGLMATYLRNKGFSVQVLDAEAEGLRGQGAAERIARMDPLLTAVVVYGHQPSASTQNMTGAGELVRALKALRPEGKVLLVGGHVAALPERTLREEAADFTCSGEGPVTLEALLRVLTAGGEAFDQVPGLLWREGTDVRVNPAAPLLQDLDREMPEVAWDLLPMERYRAHNWHCLGLPDRKPYAALYTTLGCPYHCSFCCIQAPFRGGERLMGIRREVNSYRFWSPESVLAQIDHLVTRYGVKQIKIADEMFVLNPRHVLAICEGLIERRYDLNLWAYARVDTVREGMLEKLRAAGFRWLAFGIEAANDKVRQDVQKGFSQDQIFETIQKVQSAGIHVIGNYIFGLPEDNLDTMRQTLDLALELNCEFANFYSAMAYPGSPLYEAALGEGRPLPERWSGYSQHAVDTLPLATRHLPSEEVLRFRDQAFTTYFSSPRYLAMIRTRFGINALEQIREMTSRRLVRNRLEGAG